jgi:hypothetical protein
MSIETAVREMVREEVTRLIQPLTKAIAALQQDSGSSSIAAQVAALLQGGAIKRGPGRPPKARAANIILFDAKATKKGPKGKKGKRTRIEMEPGRLCAIIDCGKPARSKGYCSAHYQKFRNLAKSKRLPADWVEYANPATVTDFKLPRGRAGAKALAEHKKKG